MRQLQQGGSAQEEEVPEELPEVPHRPADQLRDERVGAQEAALQCRLRPVGRCELGPIDRA